jgi:predicted alpha/beta-hydrolase family hydrolase
VNLLLFPGAGSSSSNPSLVAIEQAVAPMRCVRADFPYRKAGRRAPDRPPILLQTVRDEAAPLLRGGLVLGGRSMGGRICSMVVGDAEDPLPAKGLVLISYPLHPPGKPETLRVEHFPRVGVPCLFVHGTRDPFATPDELQSWTATIPGAVTHEWIDGRGHDLKGADQQVARIVAAWIKTLPASRR